LRSNNRREGNLGRRGAKLDGFDMSKKGAIYRVDKMEDHLKSMVMNSIELVGL
jgi:hypothetical protein